MLALTANPSMFAALLGGWEIILILAVVLILFGAKNFPKITGGLDDRVFRFLKRVGGLSSELDQEARDAGESLGGIYGRPAAQALTPDNQTAELYDPAVFHNQERTNGASKRIWLRCWCRLWRLIWHFVLKKRKSRV